MENGGQWDESFTVQILQSTFLSVDTVPTLCMGLDEHSLDAHLFAKITMANPSNLLLACASKSLKKIQIKLFIISHEIIDDLHVIE